MTIFNGQMEQASEIAIAAMRDLYSTLDTYRLNFENTSNPMLTTKSPAKEVAKALDLTLNYVCEDIKDKHDRLSSFSTQYGIEFANYYGTDWSKRLTDCIKGLSDLDTFLNGKIKANYEDGSGNELSKELTTADRTVIAKEFKTVLGIS